jgi:hypothetical protein
MRTSPQQRHVHIITKADDRLTILEGTHLRAEAFAVARKLAAALAINSAAAAAADWLLWRTTIIGPLAAASLNLRT